MASPIIETNGLTRNYGDICALKPLDLLAPPAHRGRLAGMFQFNIVFGIIIAFLSNYLLKDVGDNAWRWMLGVAVLPTVAYVLLCFGLPESPRWLLGRSEAKQD